MIDGWFMGKRISKTKIFEPYTGEGIRNYCLSLLKEDQKLFRIYYYDTEPLNKKGQNPVSKRNIDFGKTAIAQKQTQLLDDIRQCPNFALRLGVTSWRGNWTLSQKILKNILNGKMKTSDIKDKDIRPDIQQKGVDMKIGLDIATLSYKKLVDKIIVITGDQDIVPALKHARKEGIIIEVNSMKNPVSSSLKEHTDLFI